MAIANAVQATAPSERPIKCPLCQNIIKHARNLRRHVFKRHLPAAQRGEITETDVKNVLEHKLRAINVTPLTDDELREVHQRIRRRGFKAPRKKRGVAALPSSVNTANIDENEVTIRKLPPVRRDKRVQQIQQATIGVPTNIFSGVINTVAQITELPRAEVIVSPREDILQEALAARDNEPQEEVMNLAVTQEHQHHHPLPPMSVVVSQSLPQSIQVASHPISLTVTQTAGGVHARIPAEAALHAGVRLQTTDSSTIHLTRELMHPISFEPQVAISENLAAYHSTSSQVLAQTSSPVSSASGYVPACYWSSTSVAGLSGTTFQNPQPVFAAPTHTEYYTTTGVHVTAIRPSDRTTPQPRKKAYQ